MNLLKIIQKTVNKGSSYVLLFNYIFAKSGGTNSTEFTIVFLSKYSGLTFETIKYYIEENNNEFIIDNNNKLSIKLDEKILSTKYERVEPKTAISKIENQLIDTVLMTLNSVTGKNFKPKTPSHRNHIRARIKEGMVLEDFQYVIQIKAMEWLNTNDLFLRPQTLFGTKMDSYRNQKIINQNKEKLAKINEAISNTENYDWEANS